MFLFFCLIKQEKEGSGGLFKKEEENEGHTTKKTTHTNTATRVEHICWPFNKNHQVTNVDKCNGNVIIPHNR